MKKIGLVGILLFFSLISVVFAQSTKHFNVKKGVIAKGYDVVEYFEGNAKEGNKKYQEKYKGTIFYFNSDKNKQIFLDNPSKFMPAYGGWCAYAMGDNGEKVDINPETFEIMDGKLYLFYDKFFNNTKDKWDKNPKELKKKADSNWKKFL